MDTVLQQQKQLTATQQMVLDKVINAIKFLVRFPTWFIPAKYVGYRRVIITWAIAVLIALQKLDIANTTQKVCAVIEAFMHLFKPEFICSPETLTAVLLAWIGALYEALKEDEKPSIFTNLKATIALPIKMLNSKTEVKQAA